ncbi:MAG: glycosyltransferase family 39 protein [Patescibacteria group bacterium]
MHSFKHIIRYGGILLLALFLRAYSPMPIDIIGDDATYAFRSVGYFDHMASQLQTTPFQWFEAIPWWVKLSFHDHPPLAFLIFHMFFALFGMTTFVAHAIPILLGVISVAICCAVGARLGSPQIGIIAGVLFAVSSLSIWISKVMYVEVLLIPLLLINLYSLLRTLSSPRWWLLTGVSFGLALATKYTAVFFLPALCYFSLISRKDKKWVMKGLILCIFTLLPVIMYNIFLYHARGHFDYQLSRLFHITTSDWPRLIATSGATSLLAIISSLSDAVSLPALILFFVATVRSCVLWIQKNNKEQGFMALLILSFILEVVFLGNAARFLSPVIPVLCLSAGSFIHDIRKRVAGGGNAVLQIVLSLVILFMFLYSVNTHFSVIPWGWVGVTYSSLRGENYGYEQLDRYLLSLYRERNSGDDVWDVAGVNKTLYIFDSNINYFPKMWYIQRRVTYQGIPFASSLEFRRLVQDNGEDYFSKKGYAHYVFIHALPGALLVPEDTRNTVADQMAHALETQGIKGKVIQRSDSAPAFRVYLF